MHPRVLIVGTVPYNTKSTSRAFDAYFHYWEKENIAQIFSNMTSWASMRAWTSSTTWPPSWTR